jgi:L-malate glycosyltransferase
MPTPIPIALFVDRYAPGGTQRQIIELLKRIDRDRFRVYPVCFHDGGQWFAQVAGFGDPIALFPIHGFRRPHTVRQLFSFVRWCREKKIAILHSWDIYSNIFGLPGAALASVPVRIGSRRGLAGPAGVQHLQRASSRAAHRIVANSQAAAQQLLEEGLPEHKIAVIPNGIDVSAFRQRQYPARPSRIAMVACLREEKRIDVLVAAAPRVLESHPDAQFLIVGDGPCRDALVAQARALGLLGHFQFLGHRDDVPAVLSEADLLVLPSEMEAFPNAILEGMAAGLPVVATSVGGIPELVAHGRTGRLVPPGDPAALSNALLDVLSKPEVAAAYGRAGRRRIEETYSFERMVEQFERFYVSELEQSRVRAAAPARSRVPTLKPAVKQALMTGYLASRLPAARDGVNRKLGRTRLTVLAYHQVTDPANDGSSVSIAAFQEQMAYLKANYRVVRLADGVKALNAGGPPERLVAITFDDGYLDNATIAAPMLRSLDLPATFFVSTNMIGGNCPFPHDVLSGRVAQQPMTWDHLRSLAAQGFDIGSHTCSHADMGAISVEEAERELRCSRERIEQEIKRPARLFAFPYGRRRNMRPETMAVARREYDVCCFAYGGHNTGPANPSEIRRVVISSGVTFLAFRAVVEGWPMVRLANPQRVPMPNRAGAVAY